MTTATKIPVNSIVIPESFVDLCKVWAGGDDCLLYAIASTGNLTTGTLRLGDYYCDEQCYYALWLDFLTNVVSVRKLAGEDHADHIDLVKFEWWVDKQCERLNESYWS